MQQTMFKFESGILFTSTYVIRHINCSCGRSDSVDQMVHVIHVMPGFTLNVHIYKEPHVAIGFVLTAFD